MPDIDLMLRCLLSRYPVTCRPDSSPNEEVGQNMQHPTLTANSVRRNLWLNCVTPLYEAEGSMQD